jgi:hypothetical protein
LVIHENAPSSHQHHDLHGENLTVQANTAQTATLFNTYIPYAAVYVKTTGIAVRPICIERVIDRLIVKCITGLRAASAETVKRPTIFEALATYRAVSVELAGDGGGRPDEPEQASRE